MGSIIVITSGKGGTGKTTVTAGLSCALSMLGRKVLAVDCDIGLHNLDLALGLQDRVVFDFEDVLSGRTEPENAIIEHGDIPRLSLLPSPPVQCGTIEPGAFAKLIRSLSSEYDYCIIDSPAGIGHGFRLSSAAADRALIVSTPDTPCVMDSSVAAGILLDRGVSDVSLILNKVSKKRIRKKRSYNIDESIDGIGIPLAGIIYEDDSVNAAFNGCTPLMTLKTSKAARCLIDIAKRLEGFPVRPNF
jgi:septum site-determining protein MinD